MNGGGKTFFVYARGGGKAFFPLNFPNSAIVSKGLYCILPKRKICAICDKKFNKDSTYDRHMQKEHNTRKVN